MIFTLSGILGAVLACGAYLGLHYHRLGLKAYAELNLASALLCGLSLVGAFNLGSALIELFFAIVSLAALTKKGPSPWTPSSRFPAWFSRLRLPSPRWPPSWVPTVARPLQLELPF